MQLSLRRPSPLQRAVLQSQKLWYVIGGLAAVVFGRALLPLVLTRLANRALGKASPYRGTIDDARLDFWQGRLVVRGVSVSAPGEGQPVSAATVDEVIVRFDWKKLFRGVVVASADVVRPAVLLRADAADKSGRQKMVEALPERPEAANEVTDAPAATGPVQRPLQPTDPEQRWNRRVQKLFPIRIDHVAIRHGEIRVQGLPGQNGSDVRVRNMNLRVDNLTNSDRLSNSLAARVHADADVMGGRLRLDGHAFPLADEPTFQTELALEKLDLTNVAGFVKSQAGTDIRRGEFSVVAEAAGAEGRLKGYAKPLIEHLEAVKDGGDGQLKGAVLRNVAHLLKNGKTDRIATRVEFDGDLTDPSVGVATAVKTTLRNAFSRPLSGNLEDRMDVSIPAVATEAAELHARKPEKPSRAKALFGVLKESVSRWSADQAPRMGATLSYYTAFSMAPLLLLAISVAGVVFGRDAVQGRVVGQLSGMIGQSGAEAIQGMIQAAQSKSSAATASVIGVISLLLGASAVMTELKFALNKIWRAKAKSGFKAAIVDKLMSVGMVLVLGFLLLVSLVASAALSAFGKYLGGVLPVPEMALHALNLVLSFVVFSAMFAAMYKALPDAKIKWGDVWVGSAVTALLFVVGKFGLGAYLGKGSVGSSYGAAGSVLVILLWIYYSAQILYLGAEFTKVYSDRLGSGVKPSAADFPEKIAY